jgi:GNAT superfamily N-acetyltransferase
MAEIRPYRAEDLGALYDICLKTADSGADGTHLYRDPKLVGHLYAGPYGVLEPQSAFVVEDDEGVGGYIVGALDTPAFAALAEADWWPELRARYPEPEGAPTADWDADRLRAWQLHHPYFGPRRVIEAYPSHLHINLLRRLQGQDFGRRLINLWLQSVRERASPGAHLGVSAANHRGLRFYRAYGWKELEHPGRKDGDGHWFGWRF